MSLVTLTQVKANSRIDGTDSDVDLQQKIDMAEALVVAYLQCNVYATQVELDAAIAAVPDALVAAKAAYDIAYEAALAIEDADLSLIEQEHAMTLYMRQVYAATRTRFGVVLNARITHAILLAVEWANENRAGEKDMPDAIKVLLDDDRCYA